MVLREGTSAANSISKALAACLLCFSLTACAALGAGTPPDTFQISAPDIAPVGGRTERVQLLVPEPVAASPLDTAEIVVKPTPYTVQFLADSQWSDELPNLVQLRLLQAFEDAGQINAVGIPGQGLAIDYQIVTEIRRFEVSATGPLTAVVEIFVKALNDRNGVVTASRVFIETEPVRGTANEAYVAALDAAFDRAVREIVDWTLGVI